MNITLWIVQALLAALFLFAGGMKLVMPIAEMTKQMALPGWFLRFIGVAEVLGALGLILPGLLRIAPGLTPLAAAGLVVIMAGATVVSLMIGPVATALIPLVVGLLAALVAWGRWRLAPDAFRVERAIHIEAPPERIFAHLTDFHRWSAWSPYEKLDPAMTRTFGGAAAGRGAVYEWDGNAKVGKGRMEMTDVAPPSRVTIKLDFAKPFEGHNTAEFTLDARGGATTVTWAMHGRHRFLTKLMGLLISMDRMMGKAFEEGLANLKAIAEDPKRSDA